MDLVEEDRELLLDLAHRAVEASAGSKPAPDAPRDTSFELQTGAGAFVTIRGPEGDLRGCIGAVVAHSPLVETVIEMATAAATRDPRFSPVSSEEAPRVKMEISVLSPLKEIKPDEIEIGKHGLMIMRNQQSGLLLPQVAVEHSMSRDQFLAETCHKAGLAPDAWRDSQSTIYGFTATVFGDEE